MGSVKWIILIFSLFITISTINAIRDYSDLPPGPYCGDRNTGCCSGRVDGCSAPIYGTLCYCDDFCNRTSDDCCPDFWSYCKGITTPAPQQLARCYFNGRYYDNFESTKINCNSCQCKASNGHLGQLELACERNICLVDTELVTQINNNRRNDWRAANYTFFWGRTLSDGAKYKLGTLDPQKTIRGLIAIKKVYDVRRIPRSFDARNTWPGWISGIKDQGWCGSSWAVSTVQVASDRLGIMSQGAEQIQYSPQHLLECNTRGQQGCGGGHLDRAWLFLRKFGVVEDRCYEYSSENGQLGKCKISRKVRSLAAAKCLPRTQLRRPRKNLYKVGPAYRLGQEYDIMHEIIESGPVQATISVYKDFFLYRGGVYSKSNAADNSRPEGYHSVRILGWGEEADNEGRPLKYWIVANTWGTLWGEDGYFRIRRGVNECEIENYCIGAWALSNHRGVSRNTLPPPNFNSNTI